MRHDANLPVLLLDIILIDAYGVDPEKPTRLASAQEVEGIEEVLGDRETPPVNEDGTPHRLIAPHVRQSFIPRSIAEVDVRESTVQRRFDIPRRLDSDESGEVP